MIFEDEYDDIVQEFNFEFLNDPAFDLEPTEISRATLNLKTPVNIINKDMSKFDKKLDI